MIRPTIGVTTSQSSGWRIFPLVNLNLWLTGGRGLRWGVARSADVDQVDGIIIGGGDDIAPELYGGKPTIGVRLDRERDALEQSLAEQAIARNIPILGICRGAQMLNVALGGNLDQDAWATYGADRKIRTILPRRRIDVLDKTHLARIAGQDDMSVNALHTQSVCRLGEGIRVSARDESGMIQAIERASDPFAIGVQWHPEHLFYARRQRSIFRALVVAARARAEARDQSAAVRDDALDRV